MPTNRMSLITVSSQNQNKIRCITQPATVPSITCDSNIEKRKHLQTLLHQLKGKHSQNSQIEIGTLKPGTSKYLENSNLPILKNLSNDVIM